MVADKFVNLDSLVWWLKFIGLVVATATPLFILIQKYYKALKSAETTNSEQGKQIQASIEDRETLHEDIESLKKGLLAIIRIELDKICARNIRAGKCALSERERAAMLYEAYSEMSGNHGMADKMQALKSLPIVEAEQKGNT
ncbi:MAG TPA: hypothetical protein PKH23_00490 [Bacillota bacterium]|nr:hypothetical protein [Bacillota bacterium]